MYNSIDMDIYAVPFVPAAFIGYQLTSSALIVGYTRYMISNNRDALENEMNEQRQNDE